MAPSSFDHRRSLRRTLRATSTRAEDHVWRLLRDRRISAKFRRQHSFGRFVADFYCKAARLVVEVDGAHHFDAEQAAYDAQRTVVLEGYGARVIRFTNREVMETPERVLEAIVAALEGPSPQPSPRTGEGAEHGAIGGMDDGGGSVHVTSHVVDAHYTASNNRETYVPRLDGSTVEIDFRPGPDAGSRAEHKRETRRDEDFF